MHSGNAKRALVIISANISQIPMDITVLWRRHDVYINVEEKIMCSRKTKRALTYFSYIRRTIQTQQTIHWRKHDVDQR